MSALGPEVAKRMRVLSMHLLITYRLMKRIAQTGLSLCIIFNHNGLMVTTACIIVIRLYPNLSTVLLQCLHERK